MNKLFGILKSMDDMVSRYGKDQKALHDKFKIKNNAVNKNDYDAYMDEYEALKKNFEEGFIKLEQELDGRCRELRSSQPALPKLQEDDANTDGTFPEEIILGKFNVSYSNFDNKIPKCVPFPIDKPLYMDSNDDYYLARKLFLRLMYALPAGKCEFTVYDPEGLGAVFEDFNPLIPVEETVLDKKVLTSEEELKEALDRIMQEAENMQQSLFGRNCRSWKEYNSNMTDRGEAQKTLPYRVLAVFGLSHNMSGECFARINRLANIGDKCGILVIYSYNKKEFEEYKAKHPDRIVEKIDKLINCSVIIDELYGTLIEKEHFDNFKLAEEGEAYPSEDEIWDIVYNYKDAVTESKKAVISFYDLVKEEVRYSESSVKTVSIPLGTQSKNGDTLFLDVGDSHVHTLIAGQTGSGKSNLLHNLILNACWRYSPDELNIYLLDFKDGVEFNAYTNPILPHAKLIATQADTEYGVTVLQHILDEKERRNDLFKQNEVKDFVMFRESFKDKVLPRIILIVDEFQRLLEPDVVQKTVPLLELIAKQGRACGIHMVLATQTLKGLSDFSQIATQFSTRIGLSCGAEDSRAIFGSYNNEAAAKIKVPYGIFNDASGNPDSNKKFAVPRVDEENLKDTISKLHELSKDAVKDVRIFRGQMMPEIPAAESFANEGALKVSLGQNLDYEGVSFRLPFRKTSEDNLVVCGGDEAMYRGMLEAAILSADNNNLINEIVYIGKEQPALQNLCKEFTCYESSADFVKAIDGDFAGKGAA